MNIVLLILATLLPLLSGVVYIVSIVRGGTKPQRTTRLLLLLISGLSFFALLAARDVSGLWLALASFVQAAVIFSLSLRFGMGGRDRLDIICFGVCIGGIVLWLGFGQSLVGLGAAIVADVVAIVPSLVKTWRLPHTEIWLFYALDCIAAVCVLCADQVQSLQTLAYPIYILFINFIFVLAIVRICILKAVGYL